MKNSDELQQELTSIRHRLKEIQAEKDFLLAKEKELIGDWSKKGLIRLSTEREQQEKYPIIFPEGPWRIVNVTNSRIYVRKDNQVLISGDVFFNRKTGKRKKHIEIPGLPEKIDVEEALKLWTDPK